MKTYYLLVVALAVIALFFVTGCNNDEDCEDEIDDLEDEIDDLKDKLEDQNKENVPDCEEDLFDVYWECSNGNLFPTEEEHPSFEHNRDLVENMCENGLGECMAEELKTFGAEEPDLSCLSMNDAFKVCTQE